MPLLSSDGTFTGYACTFNEVATGHGEMVAAGAFTEFLAALRESGDKIPLVWNHDSGEPIGVIRDLKEDDTGLWVRAQIVLATERGREIAALIEADSIKGLSIGFEVVEEHEQDGLVVLDKLILNEISVCTFPALKNATVDNMTLHLVDTVSVGEVRRTSDGYLTAFARVARTGVQDYKGSEVGKPHMDVIRIYRPPEEVFSDATLRSFAHRPVTYGHPSVPVNAGNWKKFAVGQTGDEVVQDGEYVRVPMVLMDEASIQKVGEGVRELSMGYATELKWEKGQTKDGKPYDAIQTGIRGNHLAVVAAARGGTALRIGDNVNRFTHGDNEMTDVKMKSIVVDGIPVDVADTSAAVISRHLAVLDAKNTELVTKLKAVDDEKAKIVADASAAAAAAKTALDTKDGELVALKKQIEDGKMTPEKLDALVKDRSAVVDRAKQLCGDKFVSDGKTIEVIRREAVTSKLGDATVKDMSDDAISGAFNALTVAKDSATGARDLARSFNRDATTTVHNSQDAREVAYAKAGERLKNAWKGPAAKTQ